MRHIQFNPVTITALLTAAFGIYFTVSLVLFIISRKAKGLSAHKKGFKINFIVSASLFGVGVTVLVTFTALLMAFFSQLKGVW